MARQKRNTVEHLSPEHLRILDALWDGVETFSSLRTRLLANDYDDDAAHDFCEDLRRRWLVRRATPTVHAEALRGRGLSDPARARAGRENAKLWPYQLTDAGRHLVRAYRTARREAL